MLLNTRNGINLLPDSNNLKTRRGGESMCDDFDPTADSEDTQDEETWMDYMDEGDISGNGPDDDNIDPD